MTRFQVGSDFEDMSRAAAAWILLELRAKPQALISLPTGASPARTYEILAETPRSTPGLLARARFLKLDEWGGLEMDDPATCEFHLQEKLLRPLAIGPKSYLGFLTNPPDPRAECARIADWLTTNGPIDICILGIGLNGHLGLNEPAEELQAGPHVAKLSATTRKHPMLAAARSVARYGLTLGMADLLQSRKVLLLASGAAKAEPLARAFEGKVSTRFPASFLQLHGDVTVICGREARP